MDISVVIPTYNRKQSLLSLLANLNGSTLPVQEVIIVDSGDESVTTSELTTFVNLHIHHLRAEKSVCIQRNTGIRKAKSEWVFICDDDIEMPADYLQKLAKHIETHPETGAVSGLVLQKEKGEWTAGYPVRSTKRLWWQYIFQLSVWGKIEINSKSSLAKKILRYYHSKGNHLSKAGWPVLTDFNGDFFTTPSYGLGASLVKKQWLEESPYDENLDNHGIGDNYGVAAGFPSNIHVLNSAFIYHHQQPANRLQKPLQYYRRAIALDYFTSIKSRLKHIRKRNILWSLTGNLIEFLFTGKGRMSGAALKSIWTILWNQNPYLKAYRKGKDPAEAYDLLAERYDHQTGNLVMQLDEIVFKELLEQVQVTNKNVADIGCGTGRHWPMILAKKPASITGYEVSAKMLDQLRLKYPTATVYLSKDHTLNELTANSYDLLISNLVIGYMPDLSAALNEWNRVLKNEGHIIITDFHPSAVAKGGNRAFGHKGGTITVKNYLHPLEEISKLATQMGWEAINLIEKKVDESVQSFYERSNAIAVYKKTFGMPLLYGWHFRKK